MTSSPTPSPGLLAESGLDSRLLDCWEVTLAMSLLARGRRDVRSVLGSQWWFAFDPGGEGAPRLDFEPVDDRCAALAGLRPHTGRPGPGRLAETCRTALDRGESPMVVTDAYLLPWCPYAGRKHVEHSFAVTAAGEELRVVDGYDNRTEWGDARPLEAVVDRDLLAVLEGDPATRVVTLRPVPPTAAIDRTALFQANIAALADGNGFASYRPFAEHYCHAGVEVGDFEAFCEACWTIERRRGLYATWLDDLAAEPGGGAAEAAEVAARFRAEIVPRWAEVNRFAYLALRRMRAGRRPNDSLAGLVEAAAAAEAALAAELVARFAVPGRPG
ncbi:hypothetical protein [Actinomadura rugatobispora]|uniref:Butirosin biosynthesis protein H N-terminal domain-containing protein n=1 Tax=Actinomadura rugatobispora TaxID=1994 RepID=A0ABW0ZMG6_9ACTN|nr:hypothetical protein GCM10010200_023080 [Actinomadura rugatobispora]